MEPIVDIELKYATLVPPLCWEDIFGNTAAVDIEIGFGKCGFLLQMAAQQPNVNVVGIESSHKYYRKGISKVQRAELRNVRLLWGDAAHLIKRYVPDASLANIYINFPDPWPKRRHAKRRLIRTEVVTLLAHKLRPGGSIEIATDFAAYMTQIQEIFQNHLHLYELVYAKDSAQPGSIRPYQSDYEMMFLHMGKTIYYAKYRTHS